MAKYLFFALWISLFLDESIELRPQIVNVIGENGSIEFELQNLLTEIFKMSNKEIFMIIESSVEDMIDIELLTLPLYLINMNKLHGKSIEEVLPPPSTQKSVEMMILVTMEMPQWINGNLDWYFDTALIINLNYNWNAKSLLENEFIQRTSKLALIELDKKGNEIRFEVFTSNNLKKGSDGSPLTKQSLGFWNSDKFRSLDDIFLERFSSFHGETIYIASDFDDYPLLYRVEDSESNERFGMNIKIMDVLGSWLNFYFNTTNTADDFNWGQKINGTWNGMLGMVHRKIRNMTINYFPLIHERYEDFDHSISYFTEGFGFFMKSPPPLPAWQSLIYPYNLVVWIWIGTFFLILTVILNLLYRATFVQNITNEKPRFYVSENALTILMVNIGSLLLF